MQFFTVSVTCAMQMPYEDVLPYPDFAVHLREHALYRLPDVLDAIVKTPGLVGCPPAAANHWVACAIRYVSGMADAQHLLLAGSVDTLSGTTLRVPLKQLTGQVSGFGCETQVKRMQSNVSCIWRYFTWRDPQGRALEALICSLRRKMTGGRLIPTMDWQTCTLHCEAA